MRFGDVVTRKGLRQDLTVHSIRSLIWLVLASGDDGARIFDVDVSVFLTWHTAWLWEEVSDGSWTIWWKWLLKDLFTSQLGDEGRGVLTRLSFGLQSAEERCISPMRGRGLTG